MIIYPAIDIMDGKCVRLTYGDKDQRTDYSDDLKTVALNWCNAGAKWLHVIDLDAAIEQKPLANFKSIQKIVKEVMKMGVQVQVGGGVRDMTHIKSYLNIGVSRVIVGTKAVESKEFAADIFSTFCERVVLAIDSRFGTVAKHGWEKTTDILTEQFAKDMCELGACIMNVTDILRDGTLTEPNIGMIDRICSSCNAEIIASGGVTYIEQIEELKKLGHANLNGVIIGKALYEGTIDLAKAVRLFQE